MCVLVVSTLTTKYPNIFIMVTVMSCNMRAVPYRGFCSTTAQLVNVLDKATTYRYMGINRAAPEISQWAL